MPDDTTKCPIILVDVKPIEAAFLGLWSAYPRQSIGNGWLSAYAPSPIYPADSGGALPDYLQRMLSGEWRARVPVPRALVTLLKKTAFTRKCGTTDREKAKDDPQTRNFIKNRLTEIAEAARQLRSDIGPHHTFYGDPAHSFGSAVRIRRGNPSPGMTPVFDESGGIAGYRFRRSMDPPAPFIGFDELVGLWMSRPDLLRPPTPRARAAMVGRLKRLADFVGHIDASRVTAADLAGYPARLLESGLASKTVGEELAYIRKLFALAKEGERIAIDPANNLRLSGVKRKERLKND
jgi:hypothetical protein